jgi:hypothetical protein
MQSLFIVAISSIASNFMFFAGKNFRGDPNSVRTFHYNKKYKGLYIKGLTESIKINTKE